MPRTVFPSFRSAVSPSPLISMEVLLSFQSSQSVIYSKSSVFASANLNSTLDTSSENSHSRKTYLPKGVKSYEKTPWMYLSGKLIESTTLTSTMCHSSSRSVSTISVSEVSMNSPPSTEYRYRLLIPCVGFQETVTFFEEYSTSVFKKSNDESLCLKHKLRTMIKKEISSNEERRHILNLTI